MYALFKTSLFRNSFHIAQTDCTKTSDELSELKVLKVRRENQCTTSIVYYYHTFVKSGDFYKMSTHRTLYHRKVRKILYRIRSFGRLA